MRGKHNMDQESKERLKKNIALVCLGAAFIVVTGYAIIKLGVLQHTSAERLEDRYAQEIASPQFRIAETV